MLTSFYEEETGKVSYLASAVLRVMPREVQRREREIKREVGRMGDGGGERTRPISRSVHEIMAHRFPLKTLSQGGEKLIDRLVSFYLDLIYLN